MRRGPARSAAVLAALAANTVREALAGRAWLAVAAVAALILVGAAALGALTLDDPGLAARHVGLAGVDLGGGALAAALGVSLTARELESGAAALVLTRPVSRRQLLIGRWLGIQGVSALAVLVLSVVVLIALGAQRGPLDRALAAEVWLYLVQAAVVASLAVLAASVLRPLPAGALALALAVAGRGLPALRLLALRRGGAGGGALEVACALLPNLYLYAPAANPSGPYVLAATMYGVGYAALTVLVASGVVGRRDFV